MVRHTGLAQLVLSSREQLSPTAWKILVFMSSQHRHTAFRLSEVPERLQQSDEFASYSKLYLKKLLYELVDAGAMTPTGDQGWYRLGESEVQAGPYSKICRLSGGSVAYHTALYFHGLTDYYPRVYHARTRRTLPGYLTKQKVDGIPLFISVTRSDRDYELGLEERTDQLGDPFKVTSKEKTYLDLLRAPKKAAAGFPEVMGSFAESREELDLRLLCQLAIRLASKALLKRVGYLLEFVGREDLIESLQIERRSYQRNYSRLDLSAGPVGLRDKRWHLDVNVDSEFVLDRLEVNNAGVARSN